MHMNRNFSAPQHHLRNGVPEIVKQDVNGSITNLKINEDKFSSLTETQLIFICLQKYNISFINLS